MNLAVTAPRAATPEQTRGCRVLLVRHARARSRRRWEGEDERRPLTKTGRAQAAALASILGSYLPARILSSPSLRCVDTVAPLARGISLAVEPTGELSEGHGDKALELIRQLAPETVVACSHGDVIPPLLVGLAIKDGLHPPTQPELPKGATWVLEGSDGVFERTYLLEAP